MEEQDKIETEDTDVEGHKLAEKVDVHAASEEAEGAEDTDVEGHKLAEKVDVHAASEEAEGDEPDVEGHKLANKVANKFDV